MGDTDQFLHAASCGRMDTVRYMIYEKHSDVNMSDIEGRTPVMLAAENHHYDVVNLLLMSGCDVNVKDNHGVGVLTQTMDIGDIQLVQIFLNHSQTDVNIRDSRQRTPLHIASLKGILAEVELLLSAGCDFDAQDADGYTALFLAAWNPYGAPDSFLVLETLTRAGADLDMCDLTGKPPIVAAWTNARHFAHLVVNGCDVNNTYKINQQLSLLALAKLEETEDTYKRDLLVLAGGNFGLQKRDSEWKQSHIDKLKELRLDTFNLLTLKARSRIVIRRLLPRPIMNNAERLILPPSLISYIKMDVL